MEKSSSVSTKLFVRFMLINSKNVTRDVEKNDDLVNIT